MVKIPCIIYWPCCHPLTTVKLHYLSKNFYPAWSMMRGRSVFVLYVQEVVTQSIHIVPIYYVDWVKTFWTDSISSWPEPREYRSCFKLIRSWSDTLQKRRRLNPNMLCFGISVLFWITNHLSRSMFITHFFYFCH